MKKKSIMTLLALLLATSLAINAFATDEECYCGKDPETGECLPCTDDLYLTQKLIVSEDEPVCVCGTDPETKECLPCPDEE